MSVFATEEPASSQRFSFVTADKLQQGMKWMETSEQVSPLVKITTAAGLWFVQVDSFRSREMELLASEKYEASLDEHRYTLATLVSSGEKIYLASKQHRISKFLNDFTIEDIESALASLHATFACEYGDKNPERINKEIENLLRVEEPEN